MWIDFTSNVFYYGKCDSYSGSRGIQNDRPEAQRRVIIYIVYKSLFALPFSIFSSFILINLTYRSFINLVDFIYSYRNSDRKQTMIEKAKDSFFCLIANVDDDDELIYCRNDLDYVMRLLRKKKSEDEEFSYTSDEDSETLSYDGSEKSLKTKNRDSYMYSKILKKKKVSKFKRISRIIYKWDPAFKFTSRFVNTILVAFVTLYYFVIYIAYRVIIAVTYNINKIPDEKLKEGKLSVNFGALFCSISKRFCSKSLTDIGNIDMDVGNPGFLPYFKENLSAVFITPLFTAAIITVLQLFFLVKDVKTHLGELYRGECTFVEKASKIGKGSIASSSFHFGG